MVGSRPRPTDMDDICRLCLTDDGNTTPIFGEDESSPEPQIPLSFRIMACVSVEVSLSDGLPKLICEKCLNHVNSWHEFKEICDSSQATLQEWRSSKDGGPLIEKDIIIKQEPLDDEPEVELEEDVLDITTECEVQNYMVDYIKQEEMDVAEEGEESISVQSAHHDPLSFSVENMNNLISPNEMDTEIELVPQETEGLSGLRISDIKTEAEDLVGGEAISAITEGRVLRSVNRGTRKMYSKRVSEEADEDSGNDFKVKPFSCTICDNSFAYNYLLKRHQKTHTGDRNVCVYCQKGFSSHTHLMEHLKMFVGNTSRPYSCENCRSEFSCRSQYMIHIDAYSGGTCINMPKDKKTAPNALGNFCTNLFNCAHCEATFPTQLMLRLHMKKDHLQYSCTKCNKTYTNGVALSNHMRSHSIISMKFVCNVCKKRFGSREILRRHRKTHAKQLLLATTSENNQNGINEPSEPNKSSLSEVENKLPVNNQQKESSFTCSTCHENFTSQSSLRFHLKEAHRQYNCHRCSKLFHNAVALSNHLRSHSLHIPPYKSHRCRVCMKTFSSFQMLTKHKSTHFTSQKSSKKGLGRLKANNTSSSHKLNMFSCPICHVLIRYVDSVEKHLRLIHSVTEESKLKPLLEQTLQSSSTNSEKERNGHVVISPENIKEEKSENEIPEVTKEPTSPANFTCNICNKSLANKHMLSTHMKLTHSQVPTYKCNVCGRAFPYKSYLLRHSKIHHGKCGNTFTISCPICFKKFVSEKTLNNHKGVHTRFKHYSCDSCRKSFNGVNAWQKHQRMHQKGLIYSCKLCGKKFMSRGDLHEHKKMHIKLKIYSCAVCKNSYSSSSALGKHKRRHGHTYPANDGSENSDLDMVVAGQVNAKGDVHLSSQKNTVINNKLLCNVCNKTFMHLGALKKHMTVHTKNTPVKSTNKAKSNEENKEYVCDKCNRVFGDRVSLIRHKGWHTRRPDLDTSNEDNTIKTPSDSRPANPLFIKVENSNGNEFSCEKCNKAFSTAASLEAHAKSHIEEEKQETEKKIAEYVPNKAVDQAPVVLTTQRRLACKICKKPFESKKALITHIGWHSRDLHAKKTFLFPRVAPVPKEKTASKETFVCNVCNKSFSSIYVLAKHKKLHTRKLLSSIKAKPNENASDSTQSNALGEFQCSVCSKIFKCQKYLDIHMRTHTGEKRFKCNMCPQAYTRSGSLWKHKRMHHSIKLFSCPICQKRFGLRVQLTKHMANHNMSEEFLGHSQNLVPCSFCDKAFTRIDYLRQHEKTHHGIR